MPWGTDLFYGQAPLTDPNAPLIGSDDFYEWFNITPGTDDLRVQTAVEIASAIVRNGRRIFTRINDDIVTLDGMGGCELLLPPNRLPVVAVSSITNLAWGDTTPVRLIASDYDWTETGVVSLHRGSTIGRYWTRRLRGIAVTYTHGYDPVPRDVAGVVLDLAKRLYDNPAGSTVRSETIGDYSVTYDAATGGLLPHEEDVLRRYEVPA